MKRLFTPVGPVNFYFNEILTSGGVLVHVSAVPPRHRGLCFTMANEGRDWDVKAAHELPFWLPEVLPKVKEAIKEHIEKA